MIDGKQVVANISYGKDSLANLHVSIDLMGIEVDRVVTAEVWANDNIPGDLPDMIEFKNYADAEIKRRWGIEVEHVRSKDTFESWFVTPVSKGPYEGIMHGWPRLKGSWCLRQLKLAALDKIQRQQAGSIVLLDIAVDEPERLNGMNYYKRAPLAEAGWTESMAYQWCQQNNLLSPTYTHADRGGCWFCPKQSTGQLRWLRRNYPELWNMLLKWDKIAMDNSAVSHFKPNHHTVADYGKRFQLEDEGKVPMDLTFKWYMALDRLNSSKCPYNCKKCGSHAKCAGCDDNPKHSLKLND